MLPAGHDDTHTHTHTHNLRDQSTLHVSSGPTHTRLMYVRQARSTDDVFSLFQVMHAVAAQTEDMMAKNMGHSGTILGPIGGMTWRLLGEENDATL